MIYRAIGIMSGSSLDGLDIAFVEFQENAGTWTYEIKQAVCYPYSSEWIEKFKRVSTQTASDYLLLHSEFGHYIGHRVNEFIEENGLHYQVALVSSHGHTSFHLPQNKMTAQLGDGSAIAAITGLPVVSDLRAMDVAFGGQGAPIVPIGERKLLGVYNLFLNLGGIANISFNAEPYLAFDVCPANRILNMLSNEVGREYDANGDMAKSGTVDLALLNRLNDLDYYKQPSPKSLSNEFGTEVIYPMVQDGSKNVEDGLRTYVEHIVVQVSKAISQHRSLLVKENCRLLATGGGVFNSFLTGRLRDELARMKVELVATEEKLVKYKEAMIMAFIGVLRWRQEYNIYSSVTGAERDSINGALWIGQEG